jgi:hypothetical protein
MLAGVIIAAQLLWPELPTGIPWLSKGRLRPLHANAAIFAFGGSVRRHLLLLRRAGNLPRASSPTALPPSPLGAGRR